MGYTKELPTELRDVMSSLRNVSKRDYFLLSRECPKEMIVSKMVMKVKPKDHNHSYIVVETFKVNIACLFILLSVIKLNIFHIFLNQKQNKKRVMKISKD